MSIYDRHYSQEPQSSPFGSSMKFLFPSVTPVVRWLLIANIVVFIPGFLIRPLNDFLYDWFSVNPNKFINMIEIWRYFSYQFLHSNPMHILFNMLTLFFFGPSVETTWGSRRFAFFYLLCGAIGGIVFTLLATMKILTAGEMVGASGSICGIMGAMAVLYPRRTAYLWFVPMPMFVLVIVLFIFSLLSFSKGQNAGGEAAHLAGMAVGAAYVVWRPWMDKIRFKSAKTHWEKNLEMERRFRVDVDRILDKVHANGIQSLTWREKRILKKATQREQQSRQQ